MGLHAWRSVAAIYSHAADLMSDDMGTMPIPELVAGLRKQATNAFNKDGIIQGLVLNVLANRLQEQHTENERLKEAIRSAINRCGYAGNPEYVQDVLEKALESNDLVHE